MRTAVADKSHPLKFTRVQASDGLTIYAGSFASGSGVGGAVTLDEPLALDTGGLRCAPYLPAKSRTTES